jgi:hypothetical protein
MTTWLMAGIQGACAGVLGEVLPAAKERRVVPEEWGDPAIAEAHFSAHGASVEISERHLRWEFESPEQWVGFWGDAAQPVVAARSAIGEERWQELRPRLIEVAAAHGTVGDDHFVAEPGYLLILARRPA